MTRFLSDDFLLESPVAADLYHRYAAQLPIIDYHCHLSPALMADDHRLGGQVSGAYADLVGWRAATGQDRHSLS